MYLYIINTYIDIYLSVYFYLSVDICKCVFKIIFLWNTLPNGFKIDIYIYIYIYIVFAKAIIIH